ncbi:MAG: hypothetical protein KAW12_09025 [Candidatus Aminicenantes bacterium]|nr:hypothetical protein [Candidatus Aminicenantes bacterium]
MEVIIFQIFSTVAALFSAFAAGVATYILYKNDFKPFALLVNVGRKNPWADNDFFWFDLAINLSNLGAKVGLIEEISVMIENQDGYIKMKAFCFLKLEDGKLKRYKNWNSFLLSGRATFSEDIGFIQDGAEKVKLGLIEEGTKNAILNIEYKENPKSSKPETYSEPFTFPFDREKERGKDKKRNNKKINGQENQIKELIAVCQKCKTEYTIPNVHIKTVSGS